MSQNKFEKNRQYFTISLYALFVIAAGIIIFRIVNHWDATVLAVKHFITIISPFLIGFLIAYMVNPLVNMFYTKLFTKTLKMKRIGLKKALSIILSYVIVLGFILICLIYIIPQMIASLTDLVSQIPTIANDTINYVTDYVNKNPDIDNQTVTDALNKAIPQFYDSISNILSNIIPWLYSISVSFIKWLLNIVIAIVVSFYTTSDKMLLRTSIKKIIYAFFTKERADYFVTTLKECHEICKSYIIGKAIDSLIIGLICFILMSIFQLDYALLISVIVGITNMIPYFGPFIGAVPGVLILGIVEPIKGVIFAVLILAIQQFDGLYLGPKILGESTGVRPLGILFAITVGGAFFGVIGMFLGVPVLAVCTYLGNQFIDAKLKKKNLTFEDPTQKEFAQEEKEQQ